MSNKSEIPDILNSKTERVLLELPDYAYSHSSSAENKTKSFFLGRKNLIARLKNLIISTSSETGVYLVTGNRGVGKSSLVDKVINETSLPANKTKKYSTFILVALFLVLGLQYVINQIVNPITYECFKHKSFCTIIICSIIFIGLLFFGLIGHRSYVRKKEKVYEKKKKNNTKTWEFWHWAIWQSLWRTIKAASKEIILLPNSSNPFLRTQNVRKLVFILILCYVVQIFSDFTLLKVFLVYLSAVLGGSFAEFIFKTSMKVCEENKSKYEPFISIFQRNRRRLFLFLFTIIFVATSVFLINKWWYWGIAFVLIIAISPFLYGYCISVAKIKKEYSKKNVWKYLFKALIKSALEKTLSNYAKNCSRIYLKINFGHDVLKERDILRLITRTLSTEYDNFCRSWKHILHWRILSLAVILSVSYLFYQNIYKKDLRPLIEKQSNFYVNSSQLYYASASDIKLNSLKQDVFSKYMKETTVRCYHIQIDKAINRIWCYVYNAPEYFWKKDKKRKIEYKYPPNVV